MTERPIQPLTKISVARAQLVTALDLFVQDKDSVSIQCLACGGGEILEALVLALDGCKGKVDRTPLRQRRGLYWNAFKHLSDRKGLARKDDELLSQFSDTENDVALFVGWWDYLTLRKQLPVAAHVFQIWWLAINATEYGLEELLEGREAILTVFPAIRHQDRDLQKQMLRQAIESGAKNSTFLTHPATELD